MKQRRKMQPAWARKLQPIVVGGHRLGNALLVGLGGFIGSVLRYVLGGLAEQWTGRGPFPIGTLVVNVVGCFVIGVLAHVAEVRDTFTPGARALLIIGVLGGFTTFSSFSNETVDLWRGGQGVLALANVTAQVVLGLGAVLLGRRIGLAWWAN